MRATYVLFQRKPANAQPHWVETVEGLENAQKRLVHYASKSVEDYYLFDVNEGRELPALPKAKSAAS